MKKLKPCNERKQKSNYTGKTKIGIFVKENRQLNFHKQKPKNKKAFEEEEKKREDAIKEKTHKDREKNN